MATDTSRAQGDPHVPVARQRSSATSSTGRSTTDDFEELTFDYTPEELGIDAANAAKIEEIKRLRPLAANQPWGIFFVKFEPKQLPVVALRRILSRVVVKKRASANAAEQRGVGSRRSPLHLELRRGRRAADQLRALLARPGDRAICRRSRCWRWDELDTPLHLDDVADTLVEHLSWPADDECDDETWRERWRSAFDAPPREVVTTSKALAMRLAELARPIRDRINTRSRDRDRGRAGHEADEGVPGGARPRPRAGRLRRHVRADDRLRPALGADREPERATRPTTSPRTCAPTRSSRS